MQLLHETWEDVGLAASGLLRPLRNARELASHVAANNVSARAHDPDEMQRAIEEPARVKGLRFEAGAGRRNAARRRRRARRAPAALARALRVVGSPGRAGPDAGGYRAAGGVRGAIAQTAEEVFVGAIEAEQGLMRRMFLRLTELGDGTEDTRRRVPLAELVPEGEDGVRRTTVLEEARRRPAPGRRRATRPRSRTRR